MSRTARKMLKYPILFDCHFHCNAFGDLLLTEASIFGAVAELQRFFVDQPHPERIYFRAFIAKNDKILVVLLIYFDRLVKNHSVEFPWLPDRMDRILIDTQRIE